MGCGVPAAALKLLSLVSTQGIEICCCATSLEGDSGVCLGSTLDATEPPGQRLSRSHPTEGGTAGTTVDRKVRCQGPAQGLPLLQSVPGCRQG